MQVNPASVADLRRLEEQLVERVTATGWEPTEAEAFDALTRPARIAQAARWNEQCGCGSEWHQQRAAAMSVDPSDRLASCGTATMLVAHPETGELHEFQKGCAQRYCEHCRARYARKLRRRMREAVTAWDKRERRRNRQMSLLTLTIRTGERPLDQAREHIAHAWRLWRSWWHRRYKWAFSFVLVWEVTDGHHGHGHVHAHALAWLPQWWSWADGQAAWRRAVEGVGRREYNLPDSDGNIDIATDRYQSVSGAVTYVTKYLTKEGAGLSMAVEAAWWAASYGKRRYSVAAGWWAVVVPGDPWILVDQTVPELAREGWSWYQAARAADRIRATGPP